jgi:hypothetical protein
VKLSCDIRRNVVAVLPSELVDHYDGRSVFQGDEPAIVPREPARNRIGVGQRDHKVAISL